MKKKNKQKNNQQTSNQLAKQVKQTPEKPAVQAEPMTIEKVENSMSETEFIQRKTELLNQLQEELETYQGVIALEKENAETARTDADQARKELAEAREQLDPVRKELDALMKEKVEAEKQRDEAVATSESAKTKSAEEAKKITDKAEENARIQLAKATKEAADITGKAREKAKEALKEFSDSLNKDREDLEKREEQLKKDQAVLKKQQKLLTIDREAMLGEQETINRQKEIYSTANPAYCDQLSRELDTKTKAYDQLLHDYNNLRDEYVGLQVQVDEIRVEVQEPDGSHSKYSMKELLERIRQLREELEDQRTVYEEYPKLEDIRRLQSEASRCGRLENQLRETEQARDTFREQAMSERRLSGELIAVRRELDATHALNEHLLNELEKNKTALENRTGNVCPALTKVDDETVKGSKCQKQWSDQRNRKPIESLKDIVDLVYMYAGNGHAEEPLYYTKNDIRAFLAGMAVSKLLMLEGMSGTGKSSLPRIFAKTISGDHHLIPVESSWRDRNELLGYYNDFNKLFNAKAFTAELYRSGKAPDIPTFIVLDEMNLARIEYYFSDFLAVLQKPNEEDWLIDLVSTDMRTLPTELSPEVDKKLRATNVTAYEIWQKKLKQRMGDTTVDISDKDRQILFNQLAELGALQGAKDLIDGRQLRMTKNVWFVGTANQDESTFEVSDKVYDRAQVISLNKKGKPEGKYDEKARPGFISVSNLYELFNKAGFGKEDEVRKRLDDIDNILMEYFDLSFGNRIVTQAIKFAAVYTAAGGGLVDALDAQISTKILRKVMTSDKVEGFMALEDACKEYPKSLRMIQKRMKEIS